MLLTKSRLKIAGIAAAAVGAVALGNLVPAMSQQSLMPPARAAAPDEVAPPKVTERQAPAVEADRHVRVDAPQTAVRVDKHSGRVAVRAPYTDVRVDPDRGRVRVRAPYVDLDIRW